MSYIVKLFDGGKGLLSPTDSLLCSYKTTENVQDPAINEIWEKIEISSTMK